MLLLHLINENIIWLACVIFLLQNFSIYDVQFSQNGVLAFGLIDLSDSILSAVDNVEIPVSGHFEYIFRCSVHVSVFSIFFLL